MSDTTESHSNIIQPDWIKQHILISNREAAEMVGLKLITADVRKVVWTMAINLGFRLNGVPGRACQLLERYFYFLFRPYTKTSRRAERTAILENVKSRLMIIIGCCVQISAKMNSVEACSSPNILRVFLLCKGIPCTVSDIVKTEAEVFSMLGYRVPLWTTVDIGEQLAHEIGISSNVMNAVSFIIDLVDYLRDIIEAKMRWAATGSSSTSGGDDHVSTLHLSAAVVLVAARLEPICSTQQDTITTSAKEPASATTTERLARLVGAPSPYLTCLADIIYAAISSEDQSKSSPLILKRKRTN